MSSSAEAAAPDRTGRIVGGRYRLTRRVAVGGMGAVYEAVHALTLKRVAVKLMHPGLVVAPGAKERFLREAQAPASIGHEGIVDVIDAGVDADDGTPFLTMELLEGESLTMRLGQPGVSQLRALELLVAALEPLAAAHARGFVHRDLKPDNVFVARGEGGRERVKLLDFGIARLTSSHLTRTGAMMGTFRFMSPEQARTPNETTPAADVWSIGVMLYIVLCGKAPFEGTGVDVVARAAARPHVPAHEVDEKVPLGLSAIVDRCLAKAPGDRPADGGAVRVELVEALADPTVRAALERPLPLAPLAPPKKQDEIATAALAGRAEGFLEDAATTDVLAAPTTVAIEAAPTAIVAPTEPPPAQPEPHRAPASRWIVVAAGLGLAVVAVATIVLAASGGGSGGDEDALEVGTVPSTTTPAPTSRVLGASADAVATEEEAAAADPSEDAVEADAVGARDGAAVRAAEEEPPGAAEGEASDTRPATATRRASRRRAEARSRAPRDDGENVGYGPNRAPIVR